MQEKELSATQITDEDLDGVSGGCESGVCTTCRGQADEHGNDYVAKGDDCMHKTEFECKLCGKGRPYYTKDPIISEMCLIHISRQFICFNCKHFVDKGEKSICTAYA